MEKSLELLTLAWPMVVLQLQRLRRILRVVDRLGNSGLGSWVRLRTLCLAPQAYLNIE
ncbi:hypothetical protein M3J09_006971 [Ascochyta lentis]